MSVERTSTERTPQHTTRPKPLTADELQQIDVAAMYDEHSRRAGDGSGPKPVTCAVGGAELDVRVAPLLRALGFVDYAAMDEYRSRRPYERSRWVRTKDNRCVPELYALAWHRYGTLDIHSQPYWTDKNWTNTVPDNISLLATTAQGHSTTGNKYGARAGTPEYRKRYWSDPSNKARLRKQTRESAARKRKALNDARELLSQLPKRPAPTMSPQVQSPTAGDAPRTSIQDRLSAFEKRVLDALDAPTPCPMCGSDVDTNGRCTWCKWTAAMQPNAT